MTVFSGIPPAAPSKTAVLAHTYGAKNVYTGLIRAYAAYHITNPQVYALAMWTWAGVLVFYGLQFGVYGTVRAREATFPFVTAGTGLLWMWAQRGWYLA